MTEPQRRIKVFLCHAHSDASAVRDLFKYLRREGVDVWLDKEKLLPGADWNLEIRKAVRESDAVVVCLSKKSVTKEGYVQKEIRFALDIAEEKPEGVIFVIPARLEECEVPDRLNKWHWVDLFESDGRQKLIRALRARGDSIGAALHGHKGARPATVPTKGKETERNGEPLAVKTFNQQVQNFVKPEISPRIWIAEPRRYGESTRVYGAGGYGYLGSRGAYRVLGHLIENKGKVCSYKSLARLIELTTNLPNADDDDYFVSILSMPIRDIRHIIEKDPEHPKYLIDTGTGYKLDW